jgi:class 3 adenylate cyclase/DNA-binding CsgD family transcriptional regulator
MSTAVSAGRLLGRRSECAALDGLAGSVREGQSQALVLRGDAGIGKSALLEYLVMRASGCAIVRTAGVEPEMELAYAGLQQLCATFLDRLDRLPDPQRVALDIAFGLRAGDAPDRFLVGLALLSLLADVAEERPLVAIIDDAQWLDVASAQALAFVGRRLGAESVGLVFAVRAVPGERLFDGLPELALEGLDDRDALELLGTVLTGPLDERVRDRIVAETRGNPLALLEFPRTWTPAELAGGFGLFDGIVLSERLEQGFTERLAPLPPPTRLLLLVAAAESVGDPVLVWKAAAELGIGPEAAAPTEGGGLIDFGAQVRFGHPLVRSAVKAAAAPEERHRVHRALANVTDAELDPDRRAWHLAHSTAGLDEDVAAELERSAGRARARGGLAAGAKFHERAVELTPDPRRRAQRALLAAKGKHQAGADDAALRLLAVAKAGPLDELEQARAQLLEAQITFATTRGNEGPPLLLEAAKRLEGLDQRLARETYLEAFAAALSAQSLIRAGSAPEIAAAVLAADWEPSTSACDLLLDGLSRLTREGYVAAAPALKVALCAFQDERLSEEDELRWLWLAARVARALADDRAWDELTARHLELARRAGAFSVLPLALNDRIVVELFAGRIGVATSLAAEADTVVEATGSRLALRSSIILANWRGHDAEARALIEARQEEVVRRGEGLWLAANEWGSAQRYNGLGRYEDALAAAERAAEDPRGLGQSMWVLAELIEAAVRSGAAERARDPLAQLAELAHAAATDWALGTHARAAAMLADGATAERLYRDAIERLSRIHTRGSQTLARARLLYGEWLRREHRRVDAREQLRIAHNMLSDMGMDAFADRARRELLATGETVRKRTVETLDELTPQELQVARLAAAGQTNPEIGAQLFLSPRTVEWHLSKVFSKLGIASRKELSSALSDVGQPASATAGGGAAPAKPGSATVSGARGDIDPNRFVTAVLFTDIVGSTDTAARLGDQRWHELLDRYDAIVAAEVERVNGRLIKTTGDGAMASFDGPAAAIRCATAVRDSVRTLDLRLRQGIHIGEVERRGSDIGGIAVNLAARVQATAEPDEVLVTRTVADLVAGSGIRFEDRGEHELKGIPGRWQLLGVAGQRRVVRRGPS